MMRNDLLEHIPLRVRKLRESFVREGFDLRLVGGAVRDLLRGETPKDFDFCTDADPDEQVEIYRKQNIRYVPTGLQHGTISVVLDGEVFEITSLRTETDHDGRYAVVRYTRDWLEDSLRRDIRFNSMSLTFDGELVDPHHGKDDLDNGIVRFVGSPDERMREDYLRILRFLRFHVRIAGRQPLDSETSAAARRNAHGLRGISRERVWSEISKMIAYDGAEAVVRAIYDLGLAEHIDLPVGDMGAMVSISERTANPVSRMYALVGSAIFKLAEDWKWSREETLLAKFLHDHVAETDWKRMLVWGERRDHVAELMRFVGGDFAAAQQWEIPTFPLDGNDAIALGLKGKEVGAFLGQAKRKWFESGFALEKSILIGERV